MLRVSQKLRFISILLNLLFVILISLFHYATGPQFSFLFFYLIPIVFVTWSEGKLAGSVIAFASALAWLLTNLISLSGKNSLPIFFWNTLGGLGIFVMTTFMVSRQMLLREKWEEERILAKQDDLTGAWNRREFFETLDAEVSRNHRYEHPLSVAFIDLDNFKEINDQYGHQTGDEVLKTVTRVITRSIRASDRMARLGGDEFGILFPETGSDTVVSIGNKIQANLLAAMEEKSWPVTSSIGLVTYVPLPDLSNYRISSESIMEEADRLMYQAKRSGKCGIKHVIMKS